MKIKKIFFLGGGGGGVTEWENMEGCVIFLEGVSMV